MCFPVMVCTETELAEHDKMAHTVEIDAEVLRRDGFGDEKWFTCLVAEPVPAEKTESDTPKLIGHAFWFYTFRTEYGRSMYIEDLYVQEHYRRKGVGRALWREAAKIGLGKGCRNIVWSCLSWNKLAICFYDRIGGNDVTVKEDWHTFRMDYAEMKKIADEA
ncbi:thialysine N-epsilon-acetyltransferase-like isoform X2 [Gigantopelta aegis]|uniref:thialysine N-epsilon-acetyltransferase-like isoform X2 n=1 Tax=Gigantopelta aegis TaxID=1735272 RepID=UPI001B88B0F6|nr:thialysine N-epsilon-acetyltransferase-like isoform X2 [Gigantopelta aegis]